MTTLLRLMNWFKITCEYLRKHQTWFYKSCYGLEFETEHDISDDSPISFSDHTGIEFDRDVDLTTI